MFQSLPDPDGARLQNAPANLVVFSISFEVERPLVPSDGVKWQKSLKECGFDAPLLQKVQEQTVRIAQGVGQAITTSPLSTRDGWKVSHRSQPASATLFADGCVIERQSYPGFDVFSSEVESVLSALAEVLTPSVRTRFALRYSNALSESTAKSPAFWIDKVAPSFLGISGDLRLGSNVFKTLTITEFLPKDSMVANVRCGVQPDQVHNAAWAFVFDIELSDSEVVPFDMDSVLTKTKELNHYSRQLFQAILTPEYYAALKG